MPAQPKSSATMTKNMTAAEREARLAAEEAIQPLRQEVELKKPAWLKGRGAKYWKSILDRMKETSILDDLDAEALAIYCSQLAEREALQADLAKARGADEPNMDSILAVTKQLNAKDEKIMKYASELGCTPSGRVRLAQKRAATASESDGNGDLFGD